MKSYQLYIFAFSIIIWSCQQAPINKTTHQEVPPLTSYVNPFIGTDGPGNTYPGATVPFGMVQLSPDIGTPGWDRIAGYFYQDTMISGFSHTHLTGTGAGDMYDILVMPTNSRFSKRIEANNFKSFSKYNHEKESAQPGYYSVDLLDYDIKAELTATARTGIHRYTFPADDKTQIHVDLGYALNWDRPTDTYMEQVNDHTIQGYRKSTGWAKDQRIYFVMEFSKPFKSYEAYQNDSLATLPVKGLNTKIVLNYETKANEQIIIKTGLSTASMEGAAASLTSEAPDFEFDKYKKQAQAVWEKHLSRIKIETPDEDHKQIFYTMLYQSMLAPTLLSDPTGRYKGADGNTQTASGFDRYDTFSLWDTFRAAHPLYTIVQQDRVPDMLQSILAHYRETGLLPVWSMQGNETNMMIGYHAVPVVVDAYFKGFEMDAELAYKACVESAMADDRQIDIYKKRGYIPVGEHHENWSVSKTMEYAYDDWCIAMFAKDLGKNADYEYFLKRSKNWQNLYNEKSTWLQPKNEDGEFIEPFVAKEYTPYFCESNAWHYYWFVPQDIRSLIEKTGGEKRFAQKLDSMFSYAPEEGDKLPIFSTGMIGQYAHGNEPSHHVAYLYNYIYQPSKTQELTRKILTEQYRNEPNGHCGNEDCGQMSAWYILSALGFYPVNPAQGAYLLTAPLFERAEIHLPDNKTFTITTENFSENNIYIKNIRINGAPLNRLFITHKEIVNGGKLEFEMSGVRHDEVFEGALLPEKDKVY